MSTIRACIIVLARHWPSEVCLFPLANMRGGGAPTGARVQRHPSRASDAARRRDRARLTSHDAGRSPLGAPPRRFLAPVRRGVKQAGFTVCELASARSGGGLASGASRGVVTSHARRTPHPAPLWLVSGDALGERDVTTIGAEKLLSNFDGHVCGHAVHGHGESEHLSMVGIHNAVHSAPPALLH